MSNKAGLHLGAVFKLEQGRREPAWATVQALASALDTNCLAFSSDAAEEPAPKKRKGKA